MHESIELVIVEDKEADAELILRVLKKNNLANNFVVLKDGAEAIDYLFGEGKYEGQKVTDARLVLLDLKLPKVDGIEVLRRIKADERTSKIPVVVLSASGEERDLERAYRLGANSYVVKPIQFAEFSTVIMNLGFYWLFVNRSAPN